MSKIVFVNGEELIINDNSNVNTIFFAYNKNTFISTLDLFNFENLQNATIEITKNVINYDKESENYLETTTETVVDGIFYNKRIDNVEINNNVVCVNLRTINQLELDVNELTEMCTNLVDSIGELMTLFINQNMANLDIEDMENLNIEDIN